MTRVTTVLFGLALIGLLAPACQKSGGDVDLSSPKKSVQSLIDAGKNKNADALKKIFAEDAEGEFDKYQKGKALGEAESFFKNAKVAGVEKNGDKAKVSVQNTGKGDETIRVKKTGKGWRVVGF